MQKKVLTLETISDGAAPELFASAIKEVLLNIDDPNYKRGSKRSIVLEFEFKPHETKDIVEYDIKCKTKLAPKRNVEGIAYFGVNSEGNMEAREYDGGQEKIVFTETNIHKLDSNG